MPFKKEKRISPVTLLIYVFFAATLVGFLYFEQFHIPNREQILKDKGVRTLVNIESRLNKYESYLKKVVLQKIVAHDLLEANKNESLPGKRSLGEYDKKALDNHLKPVKQSKKSPVKTGSEVVLEVSSTGQPALTTRVSGKQVQKLISRLVEDSTLYQKRSETIKRDATSFDFLCRTLAFLNKYKEGAKAYEPVAGVFSKFASNALFDCVILHQKGSRNILASTNSKIINPVRALIPEHKDSIPRDGVGVDIFDVKVNSIDYIQFRHTIKFGGQHLFLSGFINKKDVELYSKEVDYWILIVVIISILLVLSIIPFIKVFVLNRWERLRGRDVVSSGLGLIFIIFFTALLFTTTGHYKDLRINLYDKLTKQGAELSEDFIARLKESLVAIEGFRVDEIEVGSSHNINYHEAFRASTEGVIEKVRLPYKKKSSDEPSYADILFTKFLDISKREYITNHNRPDHLYKIITDSSEREYRPFYFQTVFSYLRAKDEAIISMKSKENSAKIDVLSFDFKSFVWDVPDYEHGYALLDRELNVIVSSEKSINNFKNLRSDIGGGEFLERALLKGKSTNGEFQYGRDAYKAVILPVKEVIKEIYPGQKETAFYIMTFAKEDIIEWQTGSSALLTFFVGLFLLISLFVFLVLSMIFGIRRSDKRLFESNKVYDLFYPRDRELRSYLFLTLLSLLSILFQLIFLHSSSLLTLGCFGISQIFMFGFFRVLLHSRPKESEQKNLRLVFLIICALGTSLPYVFQIINGDSSFPVAAIFSACIFFGSLIFVGIAKDWLSAKPKFDKINWKSRLLDSRQVYPISIGLWLIATLLLPILLISNRSEKNVEESFKCYAEKMEEYQKGIKVDQLLEEYEPYQGASEEVMAHFKVNDGCADSVSENSDRNDSVRTVWVENSVFSIQHNRYDYNPSYERSDSKETFYSYIGDMESRDVVSILFWLLLIDGLIHLFARKVVYNIPEELINIHLDIEDVKNGAKTYIEYMQRKSLKSRMLIAGVPSAQRTSFISEVFRIDEEDIGFIDVGRNTEFLDEDFHLNSLPTNVRINSLVVIRFWFPECVTTEYVHRLKNLTRYIEESVLSEKNIVVVSDLTITQLEEKWFDIKTDENGNCLKSEAIVYLKYWLKKYREIVVPLCVKTFKNSKSVNATYLHHTDLTKTHRKDYKDYHNKSYYAPAYFSLWNSLTKKERFILFDLAEDGLVNTHDLKTLFKLLKKGVIVYDPNAYRLKVFQESFSMFVRNGVSSDEILEIDRLSRKLGTWSQIRTALILLILALVVFLNVLLPSIFNALVGALTAVAGLSSALVNLGSGNGLKSLTGIFTKGSTSTS